MFTPMAGSGTGVDRLNRLIHPGIAIGIGVYRDRLRIAVSHLTDQVLASMICKFAKTIIQISFFFKDLLRNYGNNLPFFQHKQCNIRKITTTNNKSINIEATDSIKSKSSANKP